MRALPLEVVERTINPSGSVTVTLQQVATGTYADSLALAA